MPKRLQRKRTKGFKLTTDNPNGYVFVGRPSKWGNPYRIVELKSVQKFVVTGDGKIITSHKTKEAAVAQCVNCFMDYLDYMQPSDLEELLEPLRGKDLACWCRLYDESGLRVPCHADYLLELANK